MYKILSYKISKEEPGWPGTPKIEIEPVNRITQGELFNAYNVKLFNHFGSHMDAPRHFSEERPSISELPIDRFIYTNPVLVHIPKTFKELVSAQELEAYSDKIAQADLLMIHSGFSVYRKQEPERYCKEGLGVSSDACKYLMETFPRLKSLAVDWISLSSYSNDDGLLAHQYMLSKYNRFICIIEDINLEEIAASNIKKVYSVPLFIRGVDSSPVTVIAEIED